MALPMKTLDTLPGSGQEGTRAQKVRLVELGEEGLYLLRWDLGVAPENLPSGLGNGNL